MKKTLSMLLVLLCLLAGCTTQNGTSDTNTALPEAELGLYESLLLGLPLGSSADDLLKADPNATLGGTEDIFGITFYVSNDVTLTQGITGSIIYMFEKDKLKKFSFQALDPDLASYAEICSYFQQQSSGYSYLLYDTALFDAEPTSYEPGQIAAPKPQEMYYVTFEGEGYPHPVSLFLYGEDIFSVSPYTNQPDEYSYALCIDMQALG